MAETSRVGTDFCGTERVLPSYYSHFSCDARAPTVIRFGCAYVHMCAHTAAVWRYTLVQLSMRDYAYRPRVMIIAIGYARWMRIRSRLYPQVDINFPINIGQRVLIKSADVYFYLTGIFWWEIAILTTSLRMIKVACVERTKRINP